MHARLDVDADAGHRDGAWLREQLAIRAKAEEVIHLRGVHYALVVRGNVRLPRTIRKVDDKTKKVVYETDVYLNDDNCWNWLQQDCASAARWLGYVPFDAFEDKRNAKPTIRNGNGGGHPSPKIALDLDVYLPAAEDLQPRAVADGFKGRQQYRLVIFGEKSSLDKVVRPIADRFDADLFLPTGEISTTLVYEMCRAGAADGREMVVLTLSDFDPSGWQMPISIARKVQGFRDLFFPNLRWRIQPVGILLDQIKDLGLPSTPLKEKEKRADDWRAAWGHEQTEIDALIEEHPEVLRRILMDAIEPFYDRTLEQRVREAKATWEAKAQRVLDANMDGERIAEIRASAEERFAEIQEAIAALNDSMRGEVPEDIAFPEIVIPEPVLSGGGVPPSSRPSSRGSTRP
jgi:hypothetical protein